MSVGMTRSMDDIARITRDTDAREVAIGAYQQLFDLLSRRPGADLVEPLT